MKKIICKNTFHNTETFIISKDGKHISYSQYNNMWKKLCGMPECKCGDFLRLYDKNGNSIILDWPYKNTLMINHY